MATPSLALIPTGFKAGKLYSVLPEPIYGSELVTNGDFATDTDWTKGTGVTISNGEALFSSTPSGQSVQQNAVASSLPNGTLAEVSFEVLSRTAGTFGIYFSGTLVGTIASVGIFTSYFTKGTETSFYIRALGTTTGSITNVSVKEVIVGDGDFDVTRATTATRVNEQGLIESMANNVPRLDYTDGGCPVLLTEPQSTNLITYPLSFGNSYWIKGRATVTSGQAAPSVDNPTSAFKLVQDTSTGVHEVYNGSINVTSGTTYTSSIIVKGDNRNLQVVMASGFTSNFCNFDLTTGVVGSNNGILNSKIEEISNNYYRCSVTAIANANSVFYNELILIDSATSPRYSSYTGDGTSGVYIFGAQLEVGSKATSLMLPITEGSTVTRVKDVVNNAGDVNTFNSEEGVLFWEGIGLGGITSQMSISQGNSTSNRIYLSYDSNGRILTSHVSSGVDSFVFTFSVSQLTNNKIAVAWSSSQITLYINGVVIGTDTIVTPFPINTLSDMKFNNGTGNSDFFGKTKQLKVFKTALSDAELTALTS